jgi:hypothetical protein
MESIELAHDRIDRIETTVQGHGEMIKALSINQAEQSAALHENTQLTKTIADNTDELVTLVKGSKLFYKLIVGLASLAGIFYGLLKVIVHFKL